MESPSAKKQSIPCPLPEDFLLDEIIPRLPARWVIRFKSVSKTWQSRISQYSSLLATRHTAIEEEPVTLIVKNNTTEKGNLPRIFSLGHSGSNLVEIDTSYIWKKSPTPNQSFLELIGSCDGLVCLQLRYSYEDRDRDVVLWNPATREVNYLPAAAVDPFHFREWNLHYVLCFDSEASDHKVLRLEKNLLQKTEIFSRKRGGSNWREVKFTRGIDTFIDWEKGVTIGGTIYWSVTKTNFPSDEYSILSFDVSREEFQEFEGPPVADHKRFNEHDLLNWKGSLCFVWVKPTMAELWLKNDRNTGWTMISSIYNSAIRFGEMKSQILYKLHRNSGPIPVDEPFKGFYCEGVCRHIHTLVSPN